MPRVNERRRTERNEKPPGTGWQGPLGPTWLSPAGPPSARVHSTQQIQRVSFFCTSPAMAPIPVTRERARPGPDPFDPPASRGEGAEGTVSVRPMRRRAPALSSRCNSTARCHARKPTRNCEYRTTCVQHHRREPKQQDKTAWRHVGRPLSKAPRSDTVRVAQVEVV